MHLNLKTILSSSLLLFLMVFPLQGTWGQVLSSKTHISIDERGRKKTEKTLLVQVNDKQENWLGHVEIGHNPRQDFAFNYGRILDFQGNVLKKIRKRDLATRSDLSYTIFYQDDLVTELDLYWHQYPYLIEYSYTIEEKEFLYVAYWTPVLYTPIATMNASLEVEAPSDYEVHLAQSGDVKFSESSDGDRKTYKWESAYSGMTEEEAFSPPIEELIPMVKMVPTKIEYGVKGSSETWTSFGSWLEDLNEGTDELPLSEKIAIEKIIEGTEDKREIIKKIYYYLQDHTRYINVAIDVGGLKSYPADYVCSNKYGDCKALTTYMKSMLKSVGIPSLYTVISAGKNGARINSAFPGQQFNHVVLAVPLEKDTIWLENTSNSLPFNYLGTFTQDRYALAVKGGESGLVRTPKLQPTAVLEEREYRFYMDEKKGWKAEATLNLRGSSFEEIRHLHTSQDEPNLKLRINNNLGITGFDISDWEIGNFHRDSSQVEINIKGDPPNPVRNLGSWKVINPLNIALPDFEEPKERAHPVRINYPINKTDRIVYDLNGLEQKNVQIPEGVVIQTNYGQYSSTFRSADNTVIVHENFTLMPRDIPIEEYPEFHSFIQSIIDHKKKSAILIK